MVIDLAMQIKDEIKHLITKNAELQAKVAELKAEVEKQRQRANDAERGVLNGGWYVASDRYEDDVAALTAERDQLSRDLDAEHALCLQFEEDNERLKKANRIQAESFRKLEVELTKMKDADVTAPTTGGAMPNRIV